MATTKDNSRAVSVRAITGHSVDIGRSYGKATSAIDPSTAVGRQLASRQPNTDRRRFVVTGNAKK